MQRKLRIMYAVIVINLLLWLGVYGMLCDDPPTSSWRATAQRIATVGVVFAALAQHWAYYAIRKESEKLAA